MLLSVQMSCGSDQAAFEVLLFPFRLCDKVLLSMSDLGDSSFMKL